MKSFKMKSSGRKWTEAQVQRQAQRAVARQEAKARLHPGGAKLIKAIERHIRKDSKAPLNWNQAHGKAKLEAKGIKGAIREKAKTKGIFGASWWLLVLIIAVPVLVILYIIFTREDKGEGGFEPGEAVNLRGGKDIETLLGDFGHSKPGEEGKGQPGRPFDEGG